MVLGMYHVCQRENTDCVQFCNKANQATDWAIAQILRVPDRAIQAISWPQQMHETVPKACPQLKPNSYHNHPASDHNDRKVLHQKQTVQWQIGTAFSCQPKQQNGKTWSTKHIPHQKRSDFCF